MQTLEAALKNNSSFSVFVDDGGTPGSQHGYLVKDLSIYAGVIMRGEAYSSIEEKLHSLLRQVQETLHIQLEKLHATDLVNRRGPWASVCIQDRAAILEQWYGILARCALAIPWVYIGSEEYEQLLQQIPGERRYPVNNISWQQHSRGLEIVFYKGLLTLVGKCDIKRTLVIVQDRDSARENVNSKMFRSGADVFNDTVHYRDSREIRGLQLADLAAFSLNRIFHIQNRPGDASNRLDKLIEDEFNCWLRWRMKLLYRI
jgi:hypothetical protein